MPGPGFQWQPGPIAFALSLRSGSNVVAGTFESARSATTRIGYYSAGARQTAWVAGAHNGTARSEFGSTGLVQVRLRSRTGCEQQSHQCTGNDPRDSMNEVDLDSHGRLLARRRFRVLPTGTGLGEHPGPGAGRELLFRSGTKIKPPRTGLLEGSAKVL